MTIIPKVLPNPSECATIKSGGIIMKKFVTMLTLSMLIFTSCNKPEPLRETSSAESVPAETVSEEAAAETVSETVASAETKETVSGTETAAVSETGVTTVSEIVTVTETAAVTEPERPEIILPPKTIGIDIGSFYGEERYISTIEVIDKDNICVLYKFPRKEDTVRAEVRIFGVSDGEQKAHIVLPASEYDEYIIRYGENYDEDVLCVIYNCCGHDYSENSCVAKSETKVFKDHSFKTDDRQCTLWLGRGTFSVGSHKVTESPFGNIWGADMNSFDDEPIINGIFDGYDSKRNKIYSFCFAVDENSFVYQIWGYEWTWGFGIYDFTTGTARDVPDTYDFAPLGAYNGKIYSYETYDGNSDNTIYATDIKTLETTEFYKPDRNDGFDDHLQIPQNGDYFMTQNYYPEDKALKITLRSLDDGGVISDYTFENFYGYPNCPQLIGNRAVLIITDKKLYVLDFDK